ncbi:hypothetical protein Tco_0422152 [Tanacetum coccineum]
MHVCFLVLEVKQHVSNFVKEIDNVQLGIVNQAELKLLPKAFFSFCTAALTKLPNEPLLHAELDDLCFFVDLEWSFKSLVLFLFLFANSFSSFRGSCSLRGQACTTSLHSARCEAVAWLAEGTSLVISFDAFSTTGKLELVKLETPLDVPIECSSVQQSRISLISLDNLVNFKGSSFSSVGKQLAKLCEAKSFENSSFKEVTRRLPILEMEDEGLKYLQVHHEKKHECLYLRQLLNDWFILWGVRSEEEDLVSFKISDKSSSFIFFEISSALDSLFIPESVWAVFNPSLADLV